MALTVTPKLIMRTMKLGLIRKLSLTETQISISPIPYPDPVWRDTWPHYLIVPGNARPFGGGSGARDGGGLLTAQEVSVYIYNTSHLDQHGEAEMAIAGDDEGMEDVKSKVREVFRHTYLGDHPSSTGSDGRMLLIEPLRWTGSIKASWADRDNHVVVGAVEYEAVYGESMSIVSLNSADLSIDTVI